MNDPKSIIEPIAGYFLDVVAKLRQVPFVPHSLTKLQNLNYVKKASSATTMVEIGSYKGVTTKRLSKLFEKVVSVEIDEALHRIASKRCEKCTNVEIILGDGSIVLNELAPRVSNAVLFLDGHFSGGVTSMGDEAEPVLKELDIVHDHLDNFAGFVIDDFREFGVQDGWPAKYEVIQKLESIFLPDLWRITVQYDQILVIRKSI